MFATLYVPNFWLQAAVRHQPDLRAKPVALIDDAQAKAIIVQRNEPAAQAGVTCGMAPSQGLARCMNLVVKMRDRIQEHLLGEILLQFAFTLTPIVEATAPGMCTVEFTDTRNLEDKVTHVIDQLGAMEMTARAGIARTPDASLLAAHLAKPVLRVGDVKTFLAGLPIESLGRGD
jgi:protein ImuB